MTDDGPRSACILLVQVKIDPARDALNEGNEDSSTSLQSRYRRRLPENPRKPDYSEVAAGRLFFSSILNVISALQLADPQFA